LNPPDLSSLAIERGAPGARRRPRRAWLLAGVLALAGAGVAAVWVSTRAVAVDLVTVSTAYPFQAYTLINATGYVVAQRKAAVSSKATGRLEWLGVREGSAVKKDQIIARLESRDVRAQADQAQANVAVARANIGQAEAELRDAEAAWRRARDLQAQKFVSQSAVDTAEARLNKARAGLGSAQASLKSAQAAARAAEVAVEQTLIRAPFDGVVLTKSANVGDVVTPFSSALDAKGAVVSMADMSTLEVEADVSESNLGKIKAGQPCEIQLDAFPDERFRGVVSRVVPTVDRAKASVLTKVSFLPGQDPGARILPEMSAKVAFLSQEVDEAQRTPRTVVAPEAIVTREGRSVVFTVVEGRARMVPVGVGARIGDLTEASGVTPGMRVVARPFDDLHDGAAVRAAQK
jgi:RND family efflux transporter MFP subunit